MSCTSGPASRITCTITRRTWEYLEIVSPADFKTVDVPPAVDKVPPPTPWS